MLTKKYIFPDTCSFLFCWCCHWDAGAVAAVLTEREQLIRWQHSCSTCLAGHSNYSYTSLPKNAIRALFSPKTCKWNWIDSRVGIAVLSKGNFKLGTTFPIPFCHCYHEFVMFVYLVPILFNPLWQGQGRKKKKITFRFQNFLLISPERSAAKARSRDCLVVELLENLVLDEGRISGHRQCVKCRNGDRKYWSCSICSVAT